MYTFKMQIKCNSNFQIFEWLLSKQKGVNFYQNARSTHSVLDNNLKL